MGDRRFNSLSLSEYSGTCHGKKSTCNVRSVSIRCLLASTAELSRRPGRPQRKRCFNSLSLSEYSGTPAQRLLLLLEWFQFAVS